MRATENLPAAARSRVMPYCHSTIPAAAQLSEVLIAALDLIGEPVLVFRTRSLEILAGNQAARRLSRRSQRSLVGQAVRAWGQAEFGDEFTARLREIPWTDNQGTASSRTLTARDGRRFILELRVLPRLADGDSLSVMVLRAEPSAATDEAAAAASRLDALTGLAGREALPPRAASIKSQGTGRRQWCALYFLDVDDFKVVNDQFGHLVGDDVLRTVAQRLSSSLRPDDLVVRYGGDEFVVLVANIVHPSEADRIASRITAALAPPIEVSGWRIEMTVSIGVSLARQARLDLASLIDNADRSMYRAKARRHGRRPR